MSDYTPTPDEAFNATLYTWVDWKGKFETEEEAADAWSRMIAEVERAAAAEALIEAAEDYEWCLTEPELPMEAQPSPIARQYKRTADRLRARAEAYRQERKEQ